MQSEYRQEESFREGIFEEGCKLNGTEWIYPLFFPLLSYPFIRPHLKKNNNFLYLFIIKTLNKLRLEGNYPNVMKVIYEKPTANIISIAWIQGCLLSHFNSTLYWKF